MDILVVMSLVGKRLRIEIIIEKYNSYFKIRHKIEIRVAQMLDIFQNCDII